jgi:hypothetical protein
MDNEKKNETQTTKNKKKENKKNEYTKNKPLFKIIRGQKIIIDFD